MKLYAYSAPDIPKHVGYLKIGETHGDVDKRIKLQGHELNVNLERVWHDAVSTDRNRNVDIMFHRHLVAEGFPIQQFDDTGRDTEWIKCTVVELKREFEKFKQRILDEEKQREEVGKQFYLEIRNWYYWTTQKHDSEFALRLIVRLLFCFFLQEKELVPKELFEERFLEEHLKEDEECAYYNAILRNLFFRCLNTAISERRDQNIEYQPLFKKGHFKTVKKEQFDKIPFLNGGLFNEHEGDDAPLRNDYFFSKPFNRRIPELGDDYEVKVPGLIRILSKYEYRLTIDDLFDLQYVRVVDPEFIGKVFESLLACIGADSKETRRKITGSFYTPREIVDYMVNESLDAYLETADSRRQTAEDSAAVCNLPSADLLLQCKILDPACGSGAFPCGIMNEIMRRTDPHKTLSQRERYRHKLAVLRNVIYGVDIQPIAVQISLLRLFLALIQEIVPDKRQHNYGIEPLPNLETKFVCANTLIGLKKTNGQRTLESRHVRDTIRQLLATRNQHFMASTTQEKERLRHYDESLRKTLGIALEEGGAVAHDTAENLAEWNPYDQSQSSPFFDPLMMFSVEKFDIVIGNPPYVSAPMMVKTNLEGRKAIIDSDRFTTLYQKWDLYVPFMELGLQLLSENGILAMIVPYPLTNQTYAKKIRELIISQYNLISIADLIGTKIFQSATVSNCIPIISKSSPGKACYISHIDEKKKIRKTFRQNYSDLVQDKKTAVWNLTVMKRKSSRHSKMNVLGDFCYISKGMVLNADEKTTKGEFAKDDLISETYDSIHCRKYIEAKDIERYRVKRVRYLEYNTERCPGQLSRPTFRELYEKPKLMFNRLGDLMVFFDEEIKFLHSDSMFSGVLWKDLKGIKNKSIQASIKRYSRYSRKKMETYSEKIDLRYLLGILNSKYADVLLSNLRGGDYHIYPEHLRNLPIPLVPTVQQRPIIVLVNKILSAKKKNPQSDTGVWERQIDKVVYKLYGLTAAEIAAVEK